jgi:hypothetical protein
MPSMKTSGEAQPKNRSNEKSQSWLQWTLYALLLSVTGYVIAEGCYALEPHITDPFLEAKLFSCHSSAFEYGTFNRSQAQVG